jgi:hypothetical protein
MLLRVSDCAGMNTIQSVGPIEGWFSLASSCGEWLTFGLCGTANGRWDDFFTMVAVVMV